VTDVTKSLWITKVIPTPSRPALLGGGPEVTTSNSYRPCHLGETATLILLCAGPIVQVRTVRRVKILLVEDSMAIRQENESVLHKAGYEVVCAKDGESALKLAREQQPDLILLDLILPKLSGPEVLDRLKKDAATANIPVVVLSSLTEKNRQKLIEAGAEDYVEKNSLTPVVGVNLLPKILENIMCRINRRRGIAFSSIPVDK
jgi:two-component system, cell cycle response regulator DivK